MQGWDMDWAYILQRPKISIQVLVGCYTSRIMKVGWRWKGVGKMNVFSRHVLNAPVVTLHIHTPLHRIIDPRRLAKSIHLKSEIICHHRLVLAQIVPFSPKCDLIGR